MASSHISLMKFLSHAATRLGVAKHVYVVGGAVRNFVIDKPIKDIDVVVDSVALKGKDSEWFAKQLQQQITVHTSLATNQYGVAILTIAGDWTLDGFPMKGEVIEIANAREESYGAGGKGYKPSDVKPASIEADVYRREFTFNTLMWRMSDLASGPDKAEIIDITGCGLADLKAGVMACPSDPDKTFGDDPTRMLRAIKFLLRYGFKVEGEVADSIRRNASKLRNAPQEAIASLLMAEILHEKTAAQALKAMKDLGLLAVVAEMLTTDKGFARTMANWANDKRVAHLFDLLDHGLPLTTPLDFLEPKDRDMLRRVAVSMPTGEAEELLGALRQPTKAFGDKDFMPKLAAERGVTGKNMGEFAKKLGVAVRAALLDSPELLRQPDRLKEIARKAVVESTTMFDRTALQQLVEAKDPPIMGLGSKWHIKSKKEASWSPAKDHEYRISDERDGWEFHYFAPGARTGERSGPKKVFVHGYKAADAAEADWKERSAKKTEGALDEKSPPGWKGTVKAMKKHMPDDKAFALAWSMKKKGMKPHYKMGKDGEPVKTEELDFGEFYEPEHGEHADLRDDLVAALKKAGLKDADDSVTTNGFSVGNQPYAIHGHFLASQRRGPEMKGTDLRAATREDWLTQAVKLVVAHQKLLKKKKGSKDEDFRSAVAELRGLIGDE